MNSNWSYSPETPNLGQIIRFLEPCDLEIWRMTLKNNRAPLLSIIKLYASFHHHMWIQTGVTVRKRLRGVMTSVTLTFDLWPFVWTSLLSMVITSENFMMIRWEEHSEKGVTDRQTDRRMDWTIHRAAWSKLKMPSLRRHSRLSPTALAPPRTPPPDLRRPQRVLRHEKLWNYVTWPAWENWNVFQSNWCLYSN